MKQKLARLRELREQLAALPAWPIEPLKAWVHAARPTILRDWLEHMRIFERVVQEPSWIEIPRQVGDSRPGELEEEAQRSHQAELWQENMLGFIDGLISLGESASNQSFWQTPTGKSTLISSLIAVIGLSLTAANLLYQYTTPPAHGPSPSAARKASASPTASPTPSLAPTASSSASPPTTPGPPATNGLTPYGATEAQPYGYGYAGR